MVRNATSPINPLDHAIRQAADAAPDDATRVWLVHLLQRGAAADGAVESTTQPATAAEGSR